MPRMSKKRSNIDNLDVDICHKCVYQCIISMKLSDNATKVFSIEVYWCINICVTVIRRLVDGDRVKTTEENR